MCVICPSKLAPCPRLRHHGSRQRAPSPPAKDVIAAASKRAWNHGKWPKPGRGHQKPWKNGLIPNKTHEKLRKNGRKPCKSSWKNGRSEARRRHLSSPFALIRMAIQDQALAKHQNRHSLALPATRLAF